MITREELTDKVALALAQRVDGRGRVPGYRIDAFRQDAVDVIRIALEAAIEIAREQRRPYSERDPDEAHNYAIGDVTDAIRSLIPENEDG
ncbi:hypothetical protein FHS82_000995 [Pseudochelatococcus lubricantis]|uniref:Uncharacterized protein n=1 Tax=Pseudochelatococcus lubricantis TaxID=1538102 RepID=A0ABX0UW38_9HYPH|nr:hypothetical protein [Pseudochelatococcus lubricantis]NIJ57169.1 hypothetical protein [Pseudochelatococcus lubricantis]